MKHQTTSKNDQMEYEVALEEEEAEELENQKFLPRDLEDHLYEEWRDNKALSEERE